MRKALVAALTVVTLGASGCDRTQADGQSAFKSTDITGLGVGGDFRLTDSGGRIATLADFRGKVVAVTFGYTDCPDECPLSLEELSAVRRRLGKDADQLQVLFITVDPERDTPAKLAEFVGSFDPSFIGLYGDTKIIAATAARFKVLAEIHRAATDDTHTVDHTDAIIVFDRMGHPRLFMGGARSVADMVDDIERLIKS